MLRIVFIFISVLFSISMYAQDIDLTKANINSIKRSRSYISAEATMPSEEEAVLLAKELLVQYINEWLYDKKKNRHIKQVILSDIKSCTQNIDMKRGVRTRAFVYVKKKDILTIYGDGQIILSEDERGVDMQPLNRISEPLNIKESDKGDDSVNVSMDYETSLKNILQVKTINDLKPLFHKLKNLGLISYGVYKSASTQNDCFLILYSRNGDIKGVVEKRDHSYMQVFTDETADMTVFKGCAAYWFILKK